MATPSSPILMYSPSEVVANIYCVPMQSGSEVLFGPRNNQLIGNNYYKDMANAVGRRKVSTDIVKKKKWKQERGHNSA